MGTKSLKKLLLWAEMAALFIALPLAANFAHITRWNIYASLWLVTGYAVVHLTRAPDFSWRRLWRGKEWPSAQKRFAVLRFFAFVPLLFALTLVLAPERLFQFPLQRPGTWAAVMVLYPLLSALPQELVYRPFFFERYRPILPRTAAMVAASAFCFGFVHIMFHNWIAPVFAGAGGVLFALSYTQHRSLKWAAVEHAVYGCTIFTLGLGWFFYHAAVR